MTVLQLLHNRLHYELLKRTKQSNCIGRDRAKHNVIEAIEIVNALRTQLVTEYGTGWSVKHLRHCLRTAETFPDEAIVSVLRRQLSWTHIKSKSESDE